MCVCYPHIWLSVLQSDASRLALSTNYPKRPPADWARCTKQLTHWWEDNGDCTNTTQQIRITKWIKLKIDEQKHEPSCVRVRLLFDLSLSRSLSWVLSLAQTPIVLTGTSTNVNSSRNTTTTVLRGRSTLGHFPIRATDQTLLLLKHSLRFTSDWVDLLHRYHGRHFAS